MLWSRSQNYIVTTGDISDYDGHLAFPIYKKKAMDMGNTTLVFIMNYPAYLGVETSDIEYVTELKKGGNKALVQSYRRDQPGLGYEYSAVDLYTFQPIDPQHESFYAHIPKSNTNGYYKKCMRHLAYTMCMDIWDSIPGDVPLVFVDGGVNEINPFSIDTIKTEFNIYTPYVKKRSSTHIVDVRDWVNDLNPNDKIYMDMNGSLAFYNILNTEQRSRFLKCLRSFTIMGGVLADEMVQTLSTTPFLNRFSSATMNQLYAPEATHMFFVNMPRDIPIHVVSNNEINKNLTYAVYVEKDGKQMIDRDQSYYLFYNSMKELQVLSQDDNAMINNLFAAFYRPATMPYKPFDLLSALVLVRNMCDNTEPNTNLTFLSKYGSTIISSKKEGIKEFVDNGLAKKIKANENNGFALPGLLTENEILNKEVLDMIVVPINNVEYKNYEAVSDDVKSYMSEPKRRKVWTGFCF